MDVKIFVDSGRLRCASQFAPKALSLDGVFHVVGSTSRQGTSWPASPLTALALYKKMHKYSPVVSTEAQELIKAGDRINRANQAAKTCDRNALQQSPEFMHPAWEHQQRAWNFAASLPASALYMDMGTGKSRVVCDILTSNDAHKVLIVAPLSVVGVWPNQFAEHADTDEWYVLPLNKGSTTKRLTEAQAGMRYVSTRINNYKTANRLAIVVNYDAARTKDFGQWLLDQDWDYVVFDESHKIKSPSGKSSKWAAAVAARAKRKILLTGTPMPHSPLDVWAQYRALDPAIFGSSFGAFRNRYAIMGGFQDKQTVAYRMHKTMPGSSRPNPHYDEAIAKEFDRKIHSLAFRATKDVLDLPPVQHITHEFPLSPKERKVYDELESDAFALIDKEASVSPDNALVKLLRLEQVTSGFVKDDEGDIRILGESKAKMLAEILDDLSVDEPVVVFAHFQHDLDMIRKVAEKTGRRVGELSGRQKDLTDDSTMPENLDLLAVQLQAGGVGIDLTRARYCIYFSIDFNMGNYDQSLARVHRPGQTRPTIYMHLVAEHTIDVTAYAALRMRKNIIEYLIERKGLRNQ